MRQPHGGTKIFSKKIFFCRPSDMQVQTHQKNLRNLSTCGMKSKMSIFFCKKRNFGVCRQKLRKMLKIAQNFFEVPTRDIKKFFFRIKNYRSSDIQFQIHGA